MRSDFYSIARFSALEAFVAFAMLAALSLPAVAEMPATDALASWNEGPAKQAIVDFVKATTDQSSPELRSTRGSPRHLRSRWDAVGRTPNVQPGRLLPGSGTCACEGQAGTANVEPFKTVMSGDREAMAKLSTHDL